MLVGKNCSLSTSRFIVEYCYRQIRNGSAFIVETNLITDKDEGSVLESLCSPLTRSPQTRPLDYGFHLSFTPSIDETITDDDISSLIKTIMVSLSLNERPWIVFCVQGYAQKHYHLVSTVSYKLGSAKEEFQFNILRFESIRKAIQDRGYSYGHKKHLKDYQCELRKCKRNYQSIQERFDEALKYTYNNIRQFCSVLILKKIPLDVLKGRLLMDERYDRQWRKRAYGGRMYHLMNLYMKPDSYKLKDEYCRRIEGIIEESFYLGDVFQENLQEYGILVDISDLKSPVYVDTKKKKVIEHSCFSGDLTLQKYNDILTESDWYRGLPTGLDMYDPHPLYAFVIQRKKRVNRWSKKKE